jgi:hypothetical protein
MAFDAEVIQASISEVLQIGLQLGRRSRQFAATVASEIELPTPAAKKLFNFDQSRAHLLRLELQQAFARFSGIAFGFELDELLGQLQIFILTLRDLSLRRLHLNQLRARTFTHLGYERLDTLKQGCC